MTARAGNVRSSSLRTPAGRQRRPRAVRRAFVGAKAAAADPRGGGGGPARWAQRIGRGFGRLLIAGGVTAAFVVSLAVLGVIPVRAYMDQKHQLSTTEQRVAMLDGENAELARQVALLRTRDEIERLARRQFGMVRPGERAIAIPGLRSNHDGIIADGSLPPAIGAAPPAQVPPKTSLVRELVQLARFWR